MRENNRNSIEKCRKKLPQFTTMNVIDGQAGLIIYTSLIFYSLTIDNILNIIVLLILAGVAISMLSGENGILRKAAEAKTKTEEAQKEETTTLTDMELDSHFITNNLTYKCKYGFITGIKAGEAAEELKNVLNSQGYVLRNIDNTEDVADETPLTTGMAVI